MSNLAKFTSTLATRSISFAVLIAILLFSASTFAQPKAPWATGKSNPADLEIGVVTFSVGDEIPSWFGHTAILIEDTRLRKSTIYNYGMFSFGPDMLPKFLMGKLEFWVGQASKRGTFKLYERLDRDIRVQYLDLTPDQKKKVADYLSWNVEPENRNYMYDHYYDNCSTRPRDVVDLAVDGQFKKFAEKPGRFSLRGHTRRHAQHNPYIDFLLTAWMNKEIDQTLKVWDEMFLPGELEDALDQFEYVDPSGLSRPIVGRKVVVYKSNRTKVPDEPNAFWIRTFIAGLFFGALGFLLYRRRFNHPEKKSANIWLGFFLFFVGILLGIPGVAMALFNFTEHTITHWNENIFILNPITGLALVLGPMVAFKSERALRWSILAWRALAFLTVIYVALKPLPFFIQDNWDVIAFFVPFNLILGFGILVWQRKHADKPSEGTT